MDPQLFDRRVRMTTPEGHRRFAFVSFLMLNDNYLPGALALAFSLRRQSTQADLVCLITDGVSAHARGCLLLLFDRVLEVERFYVAHARRQERQDRPYFFTRVNALKLGRDGELVRISERVGAYFGAKLPPISVQSYH